MDLSANVTHLAHEGRDIYIVGTAHISRHSVEEVRAVILGLRPDTVCVELDQLRYDALTDDSRWRNLDIFQVIKEKKVLFLLSSLVLSAYQRKMGEALGVKPGAELLAGVEAAREVGAEIVLADRHIQATLKRTWANLGFFSKAKVFAALVTSYFAAEKITAEQIEELKDRDTISDMMKEFAKHFPEVKEPLIDERDQYLMSMVEDAPGKILVVVVGAGHVEGMVANLGKDVDRTALEEIPPPSMLGTVLKWVIPAIVLAIFFKGYFDHEGENFEEMLYAWVLPNSIFAGIGALIAGARPLTTLAAIIGSPITSLNPALPLGVVTGTIEAWSRRPTVADCERVNEDSKSLRGIYANRFLRVLWVSLLTLIGSAVGGWVGASWLLAYVDGETVVYVLGALVIVLLATWLFNRRTAAKRST
jgi:pheromone shutdown-related protein TraB